MSTQPTPPEDTPLSVTQLTNAISRMLDREFRQVHVLGEVLKPGAKGNTLYFQLKDTRAVINAVSFDHAQKQVEIQHGDLVRIRGKVSIYAPSGKYQVVAETIEHAGTGNLHRQFQALKRSLGQEGLFDPDRKRPLPAFPRKIGLVTSRDGAAVHDFLNIVQQRTSQLHILLCPVTVEGPKAPAEVVSAIRMLNKGSTIDLIVVTRGGGSFESLFAFSTEPVVRAVAASRIPILCAIGHHADQSLAELAADEAAATPTEAAERIVTRREALVTELQAHRDGLGRALEHRSLKLRQRFEGLRNHPVFHEPKHLVRRHRDRLVHHRERLRGTWLEQAAERRRQIDAFRHALERHATDARHEARQRLDEAGARSRQATLDAVRDQRQSLEVLRKTLEALNPYQVLERGFSITRRPDGSIIRSVEEVAPGDEMITHLSDGDLRSIVTPEDADSSGKSG